jgi:hypothetical protein
MADCTPGLSSRLVPRVLPVLLCSVVVSSLNDLSERCSIYPARTAGVSPHDSDRMWGFSGHVRRIFGLIASIFSGSHSCQFDFFHRLPGCYARASQAGSSSILSRDFNFAMDFEGFKSSTDRGRNMFHSERSQVKRPPGSDRER